MSSLNQQRTFERGAKYAKRQLNKVALERNQQEE